MKKTFKIVGIILCFFTFLFSNAIQALSLDLSTSNGYWIRVDGAMASDFLSLGTLAYADVIGDNTKDLIVGAPLADNNGADSGSLYIIDGATLFASQAYNQIFDLSNSANYTVRLDGAASYNLSLRNLQVADLNNNNEPDLIIGAHVADENSRTDSGSVYVLLDSILSTYTGTGNIINISNSSSFNLRFDGAAGSDQLGTRMPKPADIVGDSSIDLAIGSALTDNNSRTNSGSMYLIDGDIFNTLNTTGNTFDLSTSTNFTVRIDGSATNEFISTNTNLICTSTLDTYLAIGTNSDFNSKTDSGSIYFLKKNFLNGFTGTGNTIDLATTSNFYARFDGPEANDQFSTNSTCGDIDGDGLMDFATAAPTQDSNSRADSGAVYVIKNNILESFIGTGNTVDMSNSSNYSMVYQGAANTDRLGGGSIKFADFDNNGKNDLIIGAFLTDFVSADAGSVYIINDDLIDNYTGTGNAIDQNIASNYTLRLDGGTTVGQLTNESLVVDNVDSNETLDLILGARTAGFNSRANSGSVFIYKNFDSTVTLDSIITPVNTANISITGTANSTGNLVINNVQFKNNSDSVPAWTNCSADDLTFNSNTEAFTCNLTLNSGLNSILFRTIDLSGVSSSFSTFTTASIVYDNVLPATFTPSLNVTGVTNNPNPTLTFSTTDNVSISYYQVKIDDGAFATQSSPFTVPTLSNGLHTFTVIAYDSAGNSRTSQVVSITVDTNLIVNNPQNSNTSITTNSSATVDKKETPTPVSTPVAKPKAIEINRTELFDTENQNSQQIENDNSGVLWFILVVAIAGIFIFFIIKRKSNKEDKLHSTI